MKVNKSLKVFTLAASMLAMSGVANAGYMPPGVDMNFYGASAQFLFWQNMAGPFLTDPNGPNCIGGATKYTNGAKDEITVGINCQSFAGQNVNLRYSSKASYDGPLAVSGQTYNGAANGCTTAMPNNNAALTYRPMTNLTAANAVITDCIQVLGGCADADVASFTQKTVGNYVGPLGGAATTMDFTAAGHPVNVGALTPDTPIVVPFGFYITNDVTARTCKTATPAAGKLCSDDRNCGNAVCIASTPNAGSKCYSDNDCGNSPVVAGDCGAAPAGDCPTTGSTIANISRLQAVMLFTGAVNKWSDFSMAYPDQYVTTCFRHAGSGTHATLDYAVIQGNGWGGLLPTGQIPGVSLANLPNLNHRITWFNNGTPDEIACLGFAGNTTYSKTQYAIGYADADYSSVNVLPTGVSGPILYNGVAANRRNVRDGLYDFWSVQRLYTSKLGWSTDQTNLYTMLLNYIENPNNINPKLMGVEADFWAAAAEMKFTKLSDQAYFKHKNTYTTAVVIQP